MYSCATPKKVKLTGEKAVQSKADNEIISLFLDANKEKLIGNFGKAENYFKQVIAKDPLNDASYFELAKIQAQAKRYDEALNNAEKAIKLDKNNRYYYFLKSEIYTSQERVDESVKVLERALKIFPDDPELYYELASQYIYLKQWNNAKESYQMALERFGANPDINLQIIKIHLAQGNYKQAEESTQELIKKYPKEPIYWELLGDIYLAHSKIELAKKTYQYVLEIDPFNGYIHFILGDIYLQEGKEEKAFQSVKNGFLSPNANIDDKMKILVNYYEVTQKSRQYLAKAYELCELITTVHKNDAKGYAIYGDFLLRDAKLKEARSKYRQAVNLAPDKYLIWNEIIILDAQLNDQKQLLIDTEKAVELFPNMPDFFLYRGIALAQNKNFDDAADILEAGKGIVIDNLPLKAQFHSNLGDIYNELKEYKKSDRDYNACLDIDPDNAFVLNNFSYYLSLRKDKLDLAERMSKKAIELEPKQASFLDTYGWILYQRGKYGEAKKYLDQALEMGGIASGTILEHYGDVLFQLNDIDGAMVYWKKAATTNEASEFLVKKISEGKLYE
jgi:tetratricopeptide (TPR) repeat protein